MSEFIKTTESDSLYNNIEKMSIAEVLHHINTEDAKVATAVAKQLPQIEALVSVIVEKMVDNGRLFYIGAGTSGRLAVVDASECPPTFGVPNTMVNAIIAGGNLAMTDAVEYAEDSIEQGWLDLQAHQITANDVVIGLTASGTTTYVIEALKKCNENDIVTGCITCNSNAPVSKVCNFPIEVEVGPEFITGSTRMKSGTAQKLVLNMISSTVMIQLGRVEDNKMVNMQLVNEKLIDRGVKMLMQKANITNYEDAKAKLIAAGSVKAALTKI
jgi:N-acetylmuramic acid 6-phosphate etherase